MTSLIHFFKNNILIKIASFNSIYILLKIGIGIIMSNIIANYAGAAGLAIMGNLRNFVQSIQTFAILGFEHGLVTYAAAYNKDVFKLKQHYKTSWTLALTTSIILAIIIYLLAPWLDQYLIDTTQSFTLVFKVIALSLPFYVLFVFITSLLQGFEYFTRYITLQIIISITIFALSALLIYNYNLTGALYSIVIVPFVQSIFSIIVLYKTLTQRIAIIDLIGVHWDQLIARKFMSYSIMALVSALLLPTVSVLVRNQIRLEQDDIAAGCWEAMLRISSYYLLFATSLTSMYILPKLSKDNSSNNFKQTILDFYTTLLPVFLIGLVSIYLSRYLIIQYLFNNQEFMPMEPLFKWQLIGDFIKIITTVLAFQFIATNDIKRYLIAEVLSVASFYALTQLLLPRYGIEGVVMAHLGNYIFYLIILIILLRTELFKFTSHTDHTR